MHQSWQALAHRLGGAVVVAAGCLLLGGCALLYNPATRSVPVTSLPTGAEVWIDGELVGTTPYTADINSRIAHHIEVKYGGKTTAWFLEPEWTTEGELGVVGDTVLLLFGGTAGAAVFALSQASDGAFWSHPENPTGKMVGVALIVGGLTPVIVDAATGSFKAVPPRTLEAKFE